MDRPHGFINKSCFDYVCKLYKAIYQLRQAPHAWYIEFKNFITSIGFVCSQSDPSVMFVLIYVDDIILRGSSQSKIFHVNDALAHHFSLKDLSPLTCFFGIEVCR